MEGWLNDALAMVGVTELYRHIFPHAGRGAADADRFRADVP
ncbi:MAG: hypothetical protein ACLUHE_08340 [Christensenellales bacterium]